MASHGEAYPSEMAEDGEDESYGDEGETYLEFNRLCASAFPPRNKTKEARIQSDMSWEPVREWLRSHSLEEVRQAAEQRGDSNMTALHFACRNGSLIDVIDVILSVAGETVQWPDSFGWLPIHYACACGAEEGVIKKLAEEFPESKTTIDRRGRTPLHFALGNQNPDQLATPAVVAILSSTGAAAYADEHGMLPLHYACAYGASEEALYVLTDAFKDAIWTMDIKRRTPLHFALSNAGRKASPGAVRHLLNLNPSLVNSIDNGPLPLRVLAEFSYTIRKSGTEEDKASVEKCLKHLLNAQPDPTADFFTALQGLPDWLSEKAVVLPSVQTLLNDKISQRFPTLVLMCDFFCLVMIIVFYSINVIDSIDLRFDDTEGNDSIETKYLVPLYLGVGYFFCRELVQVMSLVSLNSFHIWLYDPSNWLNVVFMTLVLFWTIRMQTGEGDRDRFRTGTCLTVIILWLKVLAFLRNMLIDFAVFVGGVFYVVKRLAAFLTCLVVILVAFAQMFVTVYQQTGYCIEAIPGDLSWCEKTDEYPKYYCSFWPSFLNVYTMLLGEVDEENFKDSTVATILFIFFMFLVVILLANVLIAIVTDSYKVIQDQRAAIVFWTNRLDFVAEMDAIANGPWKQRVKRAVGAADENEEYEVDRTGNSFGKEFWKRLMDLFDDDVEENLMSLEFWAYALIRFATAFFIIPAWLVVGTLTAGWLWPPQVREAIFTSTVSKHSSDSEKEDELRKTQVALLQKEVRELREDLTQELAVDRTQVVQMKSQIDNRKTEIANEMKHIKRIVTMLFEQQAGLS